MKSVMTQLAYCLSIILLASACGMQSQPDESFSVLSDSDEDKSEELGAPVSEFPQGSYKNFMTEGTPLLKDVEIAGWVDEIHLKAQISYSFNSAGNIRWTGIQAMILRGERDNEFTASGEYTMNNGWRYCNVPVKFVFRTYENGFLMKSYQPGLIDLDYCYFSRYRWAPNNNPYMLQ